MTRVSVEDFLTPDFPRGAWLVDGEVVVNDPTLHHQEVCARLLDLLRPWAAQTGGRAGYGGNWVVAPDTVLKPDVWWVGADHPLDLQAARVDGPPDLAVEVRSPGTWAIDVGRKRQIYEEAGLPELWLVDPFARSVLVFRRSAPGVTTFDVLDERQAHEQLTSPLLPGFALEVGGIFPTR